MDDDSMDVGQEDNYFPVPYLPIAYSLPFERFAGILRLTHLGFSP